MSFARKLLRRLLAPRGDENGDAQYRRALLTISCLVFGLVAAFLVAIYVACGSVALALVYVFAVIVFAICLLLLRRKKYDIVGATLALTVACVTLFTVIYSGNDCYHILYQFLAVLVLIITPFWTKGVRKLLILALVLTILFTCTIDLWRTPSYSLGDAAAVVRIFNVCVSIICLNGLVLIERYARKYIDHNTRDKLSELQDQAYHDPLTGLYNRRYAEIYFLELERSTASDEHCFAMADIDDFKRINDTYGHDAGDAVLRELSEILTNSIRKSDFAFRWGGEEFLIIINDVEYMDAYAVLEKIRQKVSEAVIRYDDKEIRLTLTIGMEPYIAGNAQRTIELCDEKLYTGKKSGKNVVVW